MSNDVIHPPGTHYDVRGHRLWGEQEGTGDPVMLLAGFGPAGSHLIFHPQFSALSDQYHVIYCDLYGRGRSERPSSVAELIQVMKLGPVHLYGFSYGGLIAQQLVLSNPHLIRTVALANTLHSPEMWQLNHSNINQELAN